MEIETKTYGDSENLTASEAIITNHILKKQVSETMEGLRCENCGEILVAHLYLGELFGVSRLLVKCPKCTFEYVIKGVIVKQSTGVNYGKRKDIQNS